MTNPLRRGPLDVLVAGLMGASLGAVVGFALAIGLRRLVGMDGVLPMTLGGSLACALAFAIEPRSGGWLLSGLRLIWGPMLRSPRTRPRRRRR